MRIPGRTAYLSRVGNAILLASRRRDFRPCLLAVLELARDTRMKAAAAISVHCTHRALGTSHARPAPGSGSPVFPRPRRLHVALESSADESQPVCALAQTFTSYRRLDGTTTLNRHASAISAISLKPQQRE